MYEVKFTLDFIQTGAQTDVFIRPGLMDHLGSVAQHLIQARRVFLITDTNVAGPYLAKAEQSLTPIASEVNVHIFEAGEASKDWDTAGGIHTEMARLAYHRDAVIYALGGGVVSDLAGFVAATWMRGVDWIACPTTMEAVLDAAIGGKTAVNLPLGKNLVGAFHHPRAVMVDPRCLSTLPVRDLRAGLAEAAKHAVLQSESELDWLSKNAEAILALSPEVVGSLIERNLRYKGSIASADPDERLGGRVMLNFGHTVGHALEITAKGNWRHGECVALGMLVESRIAEALGLLTPDDVARLHSVLQQLQLPCRMPSPLDAGAIWEAMRRDKKNASDAVRMVLLEGIGKPVLRNDVRREWVHEAVDSLQ